MNIQGYQPASGLNATNSMPVPEQKTATASGEGFASMLKAYTAEMNHDQKAAASAAVSLATGDGQQNTSETLLAVQKASLSFEMMLGVRNKLVDAYREVIRMQV